MKYNAIVIGLGNIGLEFDLKDNNQNIFTHTKAYLKHNNFNLIAGVDSDLRKCLAFEEYTKVKAFDSVYKLKKSIEKIDVISICTPTHIRLSLFKEIISLNPKLIIIEKPIASTLTEAKEIKLLAEKNNILLYINYMRRVEPFFIYLKHQLHKKEIRSIYVNYTNGLYTNASHFIDLMHYLFGVETNIIPISLKKNNKDFIASFVLNYDTFHIYFNGLDDINYSLGTIDIISKNERLIIQDWGFKVENYKAISDPLFPELSMLQLEPIDKHPTMEKYMLHVIEHIYNVLSVHEQIISTIDSSITTLQTCERIKNASYI